MCQIWKISFLFGILRDKWSRRWDCQTYPNLAGGYLKRSILLLNIDIVVIVWWWNGGVWFHFTFTSRVSWSVAKWTSAFWGVVEVYKYVTFLQCFKVFYSYWNNVGWGMVAIIKMNTIKWLCAVMIRFFMKRFTLVVSIVWSWVFCCTSSS